MYEPGLDYTALTSRVRHDGRRTCESRPRAARSHIAYPIPVRITTSAAAGAGGVQAKLPVASLPAGSTARLATVVAET